MDVKSGKAVLTFNHLGGGLKALDEKPLRGFFISSDGEHFEKAKAEITAGTVQVFSESIPDPIAVRYGSDADMGLKELDVNFGNDAGLPASPFTIIKGEK